MVTTVARLPAWLRRDRRVPVVTSANTITITLTLDLEPFQRAMREASRAMAKLAKTFQVRQAELAPALLRLQQIALEYQRDQERQRAQRREVMVSGLEARYYVRAGLLGNALEVCRDIRRDQPRLGLTDQEAIRLQVAACSGEAGAWA